MGSGNSGEEHKLCGKYRDGSNDQRFRASCGLQLEKPAERKVVLMAVRIRANLAP
jgi:hypothetical protein